MWKGARPDDPQARDGGLTRCRPGIAEVRYEAFDGAGWCPSAGHWQLAFFSRRAFLAEHPREGNADEVQHDHRAGHGDLPHRISAW